jgi:hypothetical protein
LGSSGAGSSGGSTGGGSPGSGDISTGGPDTSPGNEVRPGGLIQLPGAPAIVVARPGQLDLHPVSPYELISRIDGTGHVIVRVRWWGGIEPCETLDSVIIQRDGSVFTLTTRVGRPPGPAVACIEIARDTATLVDLGVLAAGTYTVKASTGDSSPLTITVP